MGGDRVKSEVVRAGLTSLEKEGVRAQTPSESGGQDDASTGPGTRKMRRTAGIQERPRRRFRPGAPEAPVPLPDSPSQLSRLRSSVCATATWHLRPTGAARKWILKFHFIFVPCNPPCASPPAEGRRSAVLRPRGRQVLPPQERGESEAGRLAGGACLEGERERGLFISPALSEVPPERAPGYLHSN